MSNLPQPLLSSKDPKDQLEALQKSRLSALIEDKGLLSRVYEAAVMLLSSEKLRACNEATILGALYKAATMGFRLEPEFGECYLIPRTMKVENQWVSVCCFQIGYRGWKAMAMQTGLISFLEAREVYAEDDFSFQYGMNAFWKHVPASESKGVTTHFYASAKLTDGNTAFEVITKQAAEKSRKNSESQYDVSGSGPSKVKTFSAAPKDIWAKHYAAMALRVPVKKVCAMLPLTPAIEAATKADGSVTYIQKDGQVVTIGPADVEESAKDPQSEQKNGLDPKHADRYLQVQDALESMTEFSQVLGYWVDFKTTELVKVQIFNELFFERVAQVATQISELTEFWGQIGPLQKNIDLTKHISKRRQQLENGNRK